MKWQAVYSSDSKKHSSVFWWLDIVAADHDIFLASFSSVCAFSLCSNRLGANHLSLLYFRRITPQNKEREKKTNLIRIKWAIININSWSLDENRLAIDADKMKNTHFKQTTYKRPESIKTKCTRARAGVNMNMQNVHQTEQLGKQK